MRLISFEYGGAVRAGVLEDGAAWAAEENMAALIAALGRGETPRRGEGIPLSRVRLLAPIPHPAQDIVCLGMNYPDHSAEAAKWDKERFTKLTGQAVYFAKRATEVTGPGGTIRGHFDLEERVDYEAELAVVLSRDAVNVPEAEAYRYVLGYSVFNDVSARALQKGHLQWSCGKSLDPYAVMGPCIVTRDELPEPPALDIRCFVNGELRQSSNTRFMIYDVAHVIAELSRGMTLKAGTILAMGTPAGVGAGFDPPRFLRPGDVVRCEIDGIGALENPVE